MMDLHPLYTFMPSHIVKTDPRIDDDNVLRQSAAEAMFALINHTSHTSHDSHIEASQGHVRSGLRLEQYVGRWNTVQEL